ncbi:MAG: peptidylprolyl isomerase [Deltaproteobacteria bacterium]
MHAIRITVLSLLWTTALACHESPRARDERAATQRVAWAQAAVQGESVLPESPYPHGAWRMASTSDLRNVVLWVSHLLIRHQGVPSRDVPFCVAGWASLPPAPARSRLDALQLARRISAEARGQPDQFAPLVARYSEDITTANRGGSLAGVQAYDLLRWPQVLDAMAVLRPGEVSNVVETEYGFHVFYRRPPPERQTVNGSRIVIGHSRAPFLAALRREPPSTRSREEAFQLAQSVYARAAADPSHFTELVAAWSEHPSAVLNGDMGEWSTGEVSDYPTQVEVLSQLAVGEVAAPVETLFGWEILLRTPNRLREIYAMTPVEVRFEIDPSADGTSESSAWQRAQELAQLLQANPERFDALQRQECCVRSVQLPDGRGAPALLAALKALRLNQIANEPIRSGFSYVIPKRIAPTPIAAVPTRFELPTPAGPSTPPSFGVACGGPSTFGTARSSCRR